MLDTHTLVAQDYPFPPVPQGSADAELYRHCVIAENFAGRFAGCTMYMEVLSDEQLARVHRAGPNLPNLAQPLPVPPSLVDDPVMALGSEFTCGKLAEECAEIPISFSIHASWTVPRAPPEGWVQLPSVLSSKLDHYSMVKPSAGRAVGATDRASLMVTATGGVALRRSDWGWDNLFAVGGVQTLLTVASDTADVAAEPGFLSDLLYLLAEVLGRHPAHREAFLQLYGFHIVASLLKRKALASAGQALATRTVDACMAVMEACGGEHAEHLFWSGVQGLLMDWDLWGRSAPETQMYTMQVSQGVHSVTG
jgi:hypothetical protein